MLRFVVGKSVAVRLQLMISEVPLINFNCECNIFSQVHGRFDGGRRCYDVDDERFCIETMGMMCTHQEGSMVVTYT